MRSRSLASPVDVQMQFASVERKRRPLRGAGTAKYFAIETLQERHEAAFIGGGQNKHAAAVRHWKAPVVEVITIARDERPAQLSREPVMFAVGRAPQVVVFDH